MKIYTKAGDDGTTGLLGQGRVTKDDPRIESYGTVDELNAVLGLARASGGLDPDLLDLLTRVQNELFAVGAALADPNPEGKFHNAVKPDLAERLEAEIDRLDAELPPLTQFILPGGTASAARLHLARTICRRAERSTVHLRETAGQPVPSDLIAYLNRLSDLLFVLARVANHRAGSLETPLGRAVNLRGKVVLITGARRVGGDLALMLADRGADVALTYHTSREAIERTASVVASRGVRALAIAADLSDAGQAESAVARVVEELGRLDVLVNMASVYRATPFASLTPGDFDAMIAANLAAPYHAAIASARRMLDRPANPDGDPLKGKILNVGDWATDRPYPGYLPYLVAKGGLTTMTLALATELAPHVAVNLIQPAMIQPPPDLSPAEVAAVIAATPLRRPGSPSDLNNLILYLLEGTDFATGACFRVDGGRTLGDSWTRSLI